MKTTKQLFLFLLSVLTLSSCVKEDFENLDNTNNFRDISIPEGFEYKTNKKVSIDIKMPNSIDFDNYRSRFDIYSDSLGQHLLSGSFNKSGQFTEEITVPATLDKLYFSSKVTDSLIILSKEYVEREYVTLDLENFYKDTVDVESKNIMSKAALGNVNTNLTNGDFSEDKFGGSGILLTYYPSDPKWYRFITRIRDPLTWRQENGNGFLENEEGVKTHYGFSQTIQVTPGDLLTFSIDYEKIAGDGNYVLWMQPRDDRGKRINSNVIKQFKGNKTRTASVVRTIPEGAKYLTVAVHGTTKKDSYIRFDNAELTGINDTDGDGVEDALDDYPNDASKAYNYYYPSNASYGSFLYEDSWPARGDYDFNDLVVDYQFKQIFNADNNLVEMEVDFKIRAIGASYKNGFAFQMDIDPNLIESVTGASLTENIISLQSNGTEAGHTKATIVVTDNAFNVLPHPGDGTGVNTVNGLTYVQPKSVVMKIKFTEPVSASKLGYMPYNPFMFINGDRGKEIHLPGYPPTDKADRSNFGDYEDDTNLALGKYYLTKKNLPWAINIPVSFDYPVEGKSIDKAYNHFAQWAQSRGFSYMDWYVANPGYRSAENLY